MSCWWEPPSDNCLLCSSLQTKVRETKNCNFSRCSSPSRPSLWRDTQHPQTCCDLPVIAPSPPARCHSRRWRCHAARCPRRGPGKTGSCPDQTDRALEGRDLRWPPDTLRTCWSRGGVAVQESRATTHHTLLYIFPAGLTHVLRHVASVREVPPVAQPAGPVPVELGVKYGVQFVLHFSSGISADIIIGTFLPLQTSTGPWRD